MNVSINMMSKLNSKNYVLSRTKCDCKIYTFPNRLCTIRSILSRDWKDWIFFHLKNTLNRYKNSSTDHEEIILTFTLHWQNNQTKLTQGWCVFEDINIRNMPFPPSLQPRHIVKSLWNTARDVKQNITTDDKVGYMRTLWW